MRRSDIILATFVLAITAMLLIPLPTALIDLLIVLNISFALLLLLVGLYMPNSLALLSFPTILLLTTLFRLSLNVASTRLILSQADAGTVIHAFGTFLVRGEIAVGIIIFTIITIVNFIVIAKGSSRVSEVAARFTLDALPGKQGAIDSDLRAGMLTAEQARQKREDLRKESQLYGSMDGAMKFVQGDAIAGFFIILTNLLGGVYLGVSNGLSLSDAVNTYAILTVGDGLVSQIPAILISICAGIVVTRVSSSEQTTLGADLSAQLFARPGVIAVSGAILVVIAFLPGLPALPFITVAVGFLATAFMLYRSAAKEEQTLPALVDGGVRLLPGGLIDDEALEESSLQVFLGQGHFYEMYRAQAGNYSNWWRQFSQDFYEASGVRLAQPQFGTRAACGALSYCVELHGTEIARGNALLDCALVESNPLYAAALGLEVRQECLHPLTGGRVYWAKQSALLRRLPQDAALRTYDALQFIGLQVAAFALRAPEEFLSVSDVHASLRVLEKRNPGFVSEVLARNFIHVSRLTQVLHQLVREGVSVRDFRQLVELVSSFCATNGLSLNEGDTPDLAALVGFIRSQRRRQLSSRYLSVRRTLRVFRVGSGFEEQLSQAEYDFDTNSLALEPEVFDSMRQQLGEIWEPLRERGILPVGILGRAEIRPKLFSFLLSCESRYSGCSRSIGALAFEEIDPSVMVEQLGIWGK